MRNKRERGGMLARAQGHERMFFIMNAPARAGQYCVANRHARAVSLLSADLPRTYRTTMKNWIFAALPRF